MANADSVKRKIQSLIDTANGVTGNADTTLTDAVEALAAGYGQGTDPILTGITITENGKYTPDDGVDGFNRVTVEVEGSGGGFPELIYETTFEVAETYASGSGVACTISTGLEIGEELCANAETIFMQISLVSYGADYTPTDKDIIATNQMLWVDAYESYAGNYQTTCVLKSGALYGGSGAGLYCASRPNTLKDITINYRVPGNVIPPGIYNLRIWRTGFKNAENPIV